MKVFTVRASEMVEKVYTIEAFSEQQVEGEVEMLESDIDWYNPSYSEILTHILTLEAEMNYQIYAMSNNGVELS